jgi:hypothetical protein
VDAENVALGALRRRYTLLLKHALDSEDLVSRPGGALVASLGRLEVHPITQRLE